MFSYYADGCLIAVYVTLLTVLERQGFIFCGLSEVSLYFAQCLTFFLACFEGLRLEGVHRFKILSVQTNYFGNL